MNLDYKNELDPHQDLTKTNSKEETALATNGPRTNSIVDGEGRPVNGGKDDLLPVLETAEEKRMRKRSHYVVYMTCFIMSLGFSIVLTGVWPYMKELDPDASKEFLGWVVAANPFGQMIASPILGWVGNKMGSTRVPFIVTILLFIVGNVLYAILPLTRPYSDYFIVLSRLIVGISAANVAICRSYAVSSSKLQERTTTLSIMAAAQSLGFILGPSIQAALALTGSSYESPPTNETNVDSFSSLSTNADVLSTDDLGIFNVYALAGWTAAILGVVNLFVFFPCIFQESNFAEREAYVAKREDTSNALSELTPDYFALVVLLFGFFIIVLAFVLLETLAVPLVLDLYAWSDVYSVKVTGVAFTIMGLISIFMFPLGSWLSQRFGERKVYILLGLLPLAMAVLCMFPVGTNYPKIKYCDHNSTSSFIDSDAMSDSFNHSSLQRQKRAIFAGGSSACDDLGCPHTQIWCFTTPIIEIPQLIVGCIFASMAYPVSFALSGAIFSKMLGFKPQGIWMGLLTSIGSFSRVVGPVVFTYIYTILGTRWTTGFQSALLWFVVILNLIFYRRLAPLHVEGKIEMKPLDKTVKS